jgi:hypothetical protein
MHRDGLGGFDALTDRSDIHRVQRIIVKIIIAFVGWR